MKHMHYSQHYFECTNDERDGLGHVKRSQEHKNFVLFLCRVVRME